MMRQRPERMRQTRQEHGVRRGARADSPEEAGTGGEHSHAWARHGRLRSAALVGLACVLGLGTVLSSCERPERGGASASERQHPPGVSAPFDVSEVMRRVHFAWRPEEGGFSASHSTYAARASGSGAWSFTGFHQSAEWGHLQSAALRIEASSLERGGRLLTPPGNAGVSEDGSLSIARGAVVERLRNGEEGVRQSWTFARRPSGAGPLTVRLRVEGLPFVGETALGLHFADASGLGARYGAATWTDARGSSTPVRVRYEAGQVLMEVPAEVVEAAAYPAALSPTISPEFGMDTPVSGPAARIQSNPDIGFDGQNFLVVWQDSRGSTSSETYDIVGARVSLTNTVLDPLGILISTAGGDQVSPAVAFDGQNYLVVWQDNRAAGNRIYGARVTTTGGVLDPEGIRVNGGNGSQLSPTLAFDGQNYLVAWQDWRASSHSDIYGTRVSPAGAVLDPNGIVICSQPYIQSIPDMAFDGQNYFLVWQDHRDGSAGGDVFGGRVSPSGAVLDGSGFAVSRLTSSGMSPAVAFDGTNYLVVWYANSGTTSFNDIYGTRVSPSGSVMDAADFVIGSAAEVQQAPALAFDGQNYLVTWEDERNDSAFDIYGARVSPARVVSSSFSISTGTGAQLAPAVGVGGGVTLVVWSDARAGSTADIYGARMTTFGGPIETAGVRISWSGNTQLASSVASDGQDYLVVWQDDRGGAYDIYGVRVRSNGAVLDSAGIAISTAANNQTSPVAVFNGQDYFVAWQDHRAGNADIYGARVSTAGVVRDPTGIAISARSLSQNRPAIATSGQSHLVVWSDERNATNSFDIYGARVGLDGTVLDAAGVAISRGASNQLAPAVAFDGQNYLVVWHDFRNGSTADIYGARVTPGGTLLGTSIPIAEATGSQTSVAVAFGEYMYVVAWRDQRNPTSDIYGARVLPDGTVLDPGGFPVSSAPGEQTLPTVAYDGEDFVVVWQHAVGSGPNDLYGARVTLGAAVRDDPGFAIAGDASDELAPRLSAGGAGRLLLVYQRMEIQAPYGTQRVRARLLTTSGEPPDAGVPDAGVPDAGAPDAGIPDGGSSGEVDAGLPDAGTQDAGAPDSGMLDAGVVDGGTPDGGGSNPGTPDGGGSNPGTPDGGGSNPGTPDGGGSNPGTPDAGGTDAGGPGEEGPDAGRLDAGTFDAGSNNGGVDAGRQDGGDPDQELPDAGSLDASVPDPTDGGRTDAGIPDAGGLDPEVEAPGSCGCTGGGSSSSLFYAGLLLAFAWRRRSRVAG